MVSEVFNGDCLKLIKKVPDSSIDCVITDCPYKVVQGGRVGELTPSGGIFSTHDDGFKKGKIFEHNDIEFSEWLPDIYRVLKDGTHCYIMINSRNLKELQTEAEKVGFRFQNLLVWDKGNKTPNRYYMQQLEFILMLSKSPARNISDMGVGNLFSIPNPVGEKLHPTEKPVSLMSIFIENSTNSGDIVLDPFMGSGSTIIAAMKLNRKYLGYELEKQYYDITCNRIIALKNKKALW